jgi:YD repeat-containing protein
MVEKNAPPHKNGFGILKRPIHIALFLALTSFASFASIPGQQFNSPSQLTNLVDAALETVGKSFDAAGNQIFLTNRLGKLWQFRFDAANRLTNTISPKGFSTSAAFNHQGLVSSSKDAKPQTTSFYYDAKGRLTNRTDSLAATACIYDPADHLTNVSETINSQAYSLSTTFDPYGRPSSFTDALGKPNKGGCAFGRELQLDGQ